MKLLSALVVDDHAEIRSILQLWLEAHGHQVACAASGNQALKLFKTSRFDLVVTDVLMPDGGGSELITQLKQARSRARILAISGGGPQVASLTCLEYAQRVGAHALLLKPFKEYQLLNAIRYLFQGDRARDVIKAPDKAFPVVQHDEVRGRLSPAALAEARFFTPTIRSREIP